MQDFLDNIEKHSETARSDSYVRIIDQWPALRIIDQWPAQSKRDNMHNKYRKQWRHYEYM
jgi:hypothetical protein